uniref:Gamma-aminobutyric acid receptor subunit pi-like n=1 Tax=Dermatophagoides pteronyssinus TaxID=6956 RepID=A0A6P6Y6F8_DERPT|nr:gamma-aminobutyric acid receptor subunit pi-like [Dermatophagoides pteronyssinus]
MIHQKSSSSITILMIINIVVVVVVMVVKSQPDQNTNFDALFRELNILTRQQLQELQAASPSSSNATTTTTTTTSTPDNKSKAEKLITESNDSTTSLKHETFRLPDGYDWKKPPKFNRLNPIKIAVNLTILDTTIDKLENVIILDMQLKERWKDRRLRMRKKIDKNNDPKNDQSDDYGDDYDDDDGNSIDGRKRRKKSMENYVLDGKYLSKLWHPISHIRNNAHITNALFDKPKQTLQKTIEQEKLIENIFIISNESTAFIWITLKMRVNIPIYECHRDDSRLFPFDKIECSFHITNALYDKRTLIYEWDSVKWDHNEYHSGQFYLRKLKTSIQNEPIIELDESGNEHSIMRIDFMLNRQIGDYILNIYVVHIFLLILSISIFWMSIQNIIIRMTLSIIILIIIKFQTFQTLKEEQRIVTALSIWTFGLSCLIILAILCHILSYYSYQHKWNEKIFDRLIDRCRNQSSTPTSSHSSSSANDNGDNIDNQSSTSSTTAEDSKIEWIKQRWNKWKQNLLIKIC